MSKKKRTIKKQPTIRIGNISGVRGNVNIAGGDISTQQTIGLSRAEIDRLFDPLYTAIENRAETSPSEKADLKVEVKEIQSAITEAVQNNEKVNEAFLLRRFRNIARMAPDILDVVIATLDSPLVGLGVAVKKIVEKAIKTKAS
jgi:hypothetical protein